MRKSMRPSIPTRRAWVSTAMEESKRDLPQRVIDSQLLMLEKKGLVQQKDGFANPTDDFRTLFAEAAQSLRNWYTPSPIDDPQSLIALEMARLTLNATLGGLQQGSVKPEELGRLSSVFAGLLRHYFKEDEAKNLMALILKSETE